MRDCSLGFKSNTSSIFLKRLLFITIMRAVVLLCLLHAAAANNLAQFPWFGPSRDAPGPVANADNSCGADQSSCGCCMMVQGANRLKTYFNKTINDLEKEIDKAQQILQAIETKRVAFTVSLYSGDNFRCYGPLSADSNIAYKYSFLNLKSAYNMDTGIFTAPYAGVYSIAVTAFSDAGSPGSPLAICISLQVNGQAVAKAKELNTNDQEDSTTIALALQLKVGDKLSVNLAKGCYLCDDSSHYNTFSAFLLYATE